MLWRVQWRINAVRIRGISRNVVVLGWVSFFTDMASEMLYPIMPLFLVGLPGGSPALLGWIDGLAEGISSGLRWIGGALSDHFGRRKPFIFAGYFISAISKPIMGLAGFVIGWPLFAVGRCSDRLGKSIRTASRDALIADSTSEDTRGIAFGFHRAMDTAGAVAGPLVGLAILVVILGWNRVFTTQWNQAKLGGFGVDLDLKWLFIVALVPGLISAVLSIAGVKEMRAAPGKGHAPTILQSFPLPFWHLLAANAVFSLGNSSDSFLILRSGEKGLAFGLIILAFALYNAIYALAAAPLGKLSDMIGRKPVVISGWIVYALVYVGFAVMPSAHWAWVLFAVYGLYQAFAEGVTKAMVSDVVAPAQRAGAIGLFYTASGLGQLVGSVLAGAVWKWAPIGGHLMPSFAIGSMFALLAVPIIATVRVKPVEA
jgi:MFS family permease